MAHNFYVSLDGLTTSPLFTFRTWTFKDLCFTANFPSFDNAMFDRVSDVASF